jgi:hypothetical protein
VVAPDGSGGAFVVGSLATAWAPTGVAPHAGFVYVLGADNNIRVLDFTDPAHPRLVSTAGVEAIPGGPALSHDGRYFGDTGFRVDNDAIWGYLNSRGGLDVFGFPVSRTFLFLGCPVQVFQRYVVQVCPNQSVTLLNLLDPEIFPYSQINFSTFPTVDEGLKGATPKVGEPDYPSAILDFVGQEVPNSFEGQPVNFRSILLSPLGFELWGAPISRPMRDPANANFTYQRFQRGIMHYDAPTEATRGVLLADYLKSILTAQALPPDLGLAAQGSRFYRQYCPGAPQWLCRPDDLPGTDLTDAFEPG